MNILGYPLDRAAAILERAGYRVETVEARSRKGVEGDSKRVVRCLPLPGRSIPTVQLVFCEFKTNVDSLRAEDAAEDRVALCEEEGGGGLVRGSC